MRTVGAGNSAQPTSALTNFTDAVRVEVADVEDTPVDLSEFGVSLEYDEGADEIVAAATVVFRRLEGESSLAPLMTETPPVALGRRVIVSINPGSGSYREVFRGRISDVDWPERFGDVTINCLDQAGVAGRVWIRTAREYGSTAGVSLETVMQAVADDNLAAPPTLYFPTPTDAVVQHIAGDSPYGPTEQSTLDALRTLAESIGRTIRWRNFDQTADDWRWTVFGPERGKTVPDYTFSPDDYWNVTTMKQSEIDIRNMVEVQYVGEGGALESVIVSDAASIAKHNAGEPLYMKIVEGSDSPVNNATLATALANAALSDLKEPDALLEIACRYFWPGEIGVDLYRFTANGLHFSSDQDLAPVAFRHRIAIGERPTTHVLTRGKPSGGVLMWRRRLASTLSSGPDALSFLRNYRLLYENDTELVYGWERGPLVASVWAAVLTLATPIVGDPFTIVSAQVQMLPADQNTLRIPKPPHKHITFWQVEPRLADFTIRLETEFRRGHVEAEAPQPPIWSLDAREFGAVGTLYWKIPPRGETIVSVMASAHTGGLPSFSYVNAHRGPGDQSYVKDRLLIADEYEHDVKLGKGRLSFITPRVVLASGAIMSPGPIPFDLDVEPRIAHAWAEAQTVHVVGDSDVKSIRFRQVDVNGLPLSWVRWLDGIGGQINVPVPNDTKWYVEVTAFALPKDDAGVLTSANDSRTLVVQGPLTEGTQMPFGWDQFELTIPAIGEKEVTLAVKAIAGAALLGHRWRVRARRKAVDGTWTDMGKITSQLVPLPNFSGAPPPTTLTEYTWDGLPAGYEHSYPTSGAQKVEIELIAEITLATQVAATLSRRVFWYVGGSTDEPTPPTPPPSPPPPPPTTEADWITVALTVPTLGTKEVGITLHATAASGTVELLRRIHTEGWTSPLEIVGDVTPALASPPASETGYSYDGLGPELARTDNPGQSTVTFEITARIKNSAGLIVATAIRSVQWIYGGDIT